MTYALLLPAVTLITGLNIHTLIDFLDDLAPDSASEFARQLLEFLTELEQTQPTLAAIPLVKSYLWSFGLGFRGLLGFGVPYFNTFFLKEPI